MRRLIFFFFIGSINFSFGQKSDFAAIDFTKADNLAKRYNAKNLSNLSSLTKNLTKDLHTDVEKFRAIYIWITHHISNDFNLYSKNHHKRKKFKNDSIKLEKWNSRFKKILFKKLVRKKRTICTGYAYLLKEMCTIAGIKSLMVNGSGRTSTTDIEDLSFANHTWNLVKLQHKWYLCDPTWATGTSYPEQGKFVFDYNDGYFLTEPKLFFFNHFPIDSEHALLGVNPPSFNDFVALPLLYANAYEVLEKHISPQKMHHEIKQHSEFTFQYKLKKNIDLSKVKLIFSTNVSEKVVKPKISLKENLLTLKHTMNKRGFYDVHFYIDEDIVATYTFRIKR